MASRIEVVGGLVQDEEVRLVDDDPAEDEARCFASGEGSDGLFDLFAREEHAPELPPDEGRRLGGTRVPDVIERRHRSVTQELVVILGEIAGADLVTESNGAVVGLDLSHDDLEEGGLPEPVRAEDRHPLAATHGQGDVLEHPLRAVRLRQPAHLQNVPAARSRGIEAEERRAARRGLELIDLDALNLLEPALRLLGLRRLRSETLHERALVRDDLFGTSDRGLLARSRGRLLGDERGEVTGVLGDRPVIDVENVGDDIVEEALIVGDDERDAAVPGEELLQPADRQDVEVVGRLVEEQRVGAAEEHLRQEHAQLESSGQRRERPPVRREGNAEPLEHRRGAGLQGVAVQVLESLLEIGEACGVPVAVIDDPVSLHQGTPHRGVPHHGEIEDDLRVVEEAVLPQDPDSRASGDGYRSLRRGLVAGQDP